ncbi:LysE/ArgO family amino acid transporter [Paludibacterium paludis]|uniref:Amino acid transporter LysE n=1 Tax=Paludibacterium paludis TaxID=1225769 RepID=A0A918P514_9NEIS|nr:LysE/ArgO family amino acid transporter [Paludibacterium paludis]GGY20284.1 amino acid transporter LysE [Paludibacterium paludis]
MFDASVMFSAFGLAFAQIVGIGPQNAYVLRQGIARSHVGLIVLVCIVCDIVLMSCGVFGMGGVIAGVPGLVRVLAWGGAGFIFWLGFKAFRAAFARQHGALSLDGNVERERRAVCRTLLMVTLLNPYALLDTIVLIGGVSSAYGKHNQVSFLIGSTLASACWFVALGAFAAKLAPWFARPASWRVLDGAIGVVMFFTGGMLLVNFGL